MRDCNELKLNLNLANNTESNNIEGYADDLLVFLPTNKCALEALKKILSDFTKISGLQLNCEKTEIMIVSYENLVPLKQFVSEVGFRNVDRICHLGIVFDNELKLLQNNWTDKLEKIKKLRNFFLCCNLTLVAKINIIKTFFLSQLCYLAPVVKPNHFFTDELKSIILRFLSPNRNIFPANH